MLKKTGHNDFTSASTVKAIVDMDTKDRLQTVKSIGSLNEFLQDCKKFMTNDIWDIVHEKGLHVFELFELNPLIVREMMVKSPNWKPPKNDILTFTVGQKETIPSYKATRSTNSIFDLVNNMNASRRIVGYNARGVYIKTFLAP